MTQQTFFKKTQEEWVIDELKKNKQISRNLCLSNYITRLGAIICDLNKKGYNLKGSFIKTEYGKDYVYKLR
jgi:hypothetical protein